MRKRLTSHLSPALVISTIALFAAIGGGVAIGLPGKKNIDANDLKRNVVASKHVKPDALTGDDINEASLALGPKVYALSASHSGTMQDATVEGVTIQKTSNTFSVNFPFSVQDCTPVVTGKFSSDFAAIQSGTGNPNRISVTAFGAAHDFNLVMVCV